MALTAKNHTINLGFKLILKEEEFQKDSRRRPGSVTQVNVIHKSSRLASYTESS